MSQVRIPEQMAAAARAVIDGKVPPATPRDAATVMLLRPAAPAAQAGGGDAGGFEVYMLRRKPSMAFAPGAYVFPGGSVDQRDAEEEIAWAGPDVDHWGQVFDVPREMARALVCAAVRETFEESGVLLAGPSAGSVVADTTGPDWEADRQALLDRSLSLAEMLARRNLILRSDLPRPVFNARLVDVDGTLIAVTDAWWQEAGVAAEIDSRAYQGPPAGRLAVA